MTKDPLPALRGLHERWGDVSSMRVAGTTVLFLFHPDDIEQVVVGHARDTDKGQLMVQLRPLMGMHLFTLEGDEHARRRRLASSAFRPRDLAPKIAPVVAATADMTSRWRSGEPIDALAEFDRVTIGAVAGSLFGRRIDDVAPQIQELVHELYGYLPWFTSATYPLTRRLRPIRFRRMLRMRARLLDIVRPLALESHERAMAEHRGDEEPGDIAARLMLLRDDASDGTDDKLTLDQITQELAGLLVAAHEGIALTVMFALADLAARPDLQARLEAEVDALLADGRAVEADDLRQMPFMRAVIDETVRRYGTTFLVRGVLEPFALDGSDVQLERGTQVITSTYDVHRDERWWRDPDAFDPDRFLTPDASRPRFAYFPFGGGRRVCIGQHLGIQTCAVMLAELLRDWTFERTDGDGPIEVWSNVLIRPKQPVTLVPRRRPHAG
jgi:cytochrome P450